MITYENVSHTYCHSACVVHSSCNLGNPAPFLVHLLSHPNHSSAVMAFLANQLHQVAAVDDAAAVNPLKCAGFAYSNTSVSTGWNHWRIAHSFSTGFEPKVSLDSSKKTERKLWPPSPGPKAKTQLGWWAPLRAMLEKIEGFDTRGAGGRWRRLSVRPCCSWGVWRLRSWR